jgi:addiction module HigA family antidote
MATRTPPHPGQYVLEDCVKPLGLSVSKAAEGLGISRSTLSRLINGRISVTPEMAVRLSQGFGSTPEMWLRLQNAHDLAQARKKRKLTSIQRLEPA